MLTTNTVVFSQLTYSLTRFAIYDTLKPVLVKVENPSLSQKLMLASIGGNSNQFLNKLKIILESFHAISPGCPLRFSDF